MPHLHAKEYLIEYANQTHEGWLRGLIVKTINQNGTLSDDDVRAILDLLISNGDSDVDLPANMESVSNSQLIIEELIHESGVCALAANQKIRFSDSITLLYGNNGSGKSSYFRILNEIVGGNRETQIRHNIYVDDVADVKVTIKYSQNGIVNSFQWNGKNRGFLPFSACSVFDSAYSSSFLGRRNANSAIVMPYGLHLFSRLTEVFDKLKVLLDVKIREKLNTLPPIDVNEYPADIKQSYNDRAITLDQKTFILSKFEMSAAEKDRLSQIITQIKELRESNIEDKIKIEELNLSAIDSVIRYIKEKQEILSSNVQNYDELLKSLLVAKEESLIVRQKISILNEIVSADSEEWKSFIKSGDAYRHNVSENICPYCHQPLDRDARKLLSAYSTYLGDKSEQNLLSLSSKKDALYSSIERISTEFVMPSNIKTIAQRMGYDNLTRAIETCIGWINCKKGECLELIREEKFIDNIMFSDEYNIMGCLLTCKQKVEESLKSYRNILSEKEGKLRELEANAIELRVHESISSQKEQWQSWFDIIEEKNVLESKKGKLSTRALSTMSKTATQELVTSSLRDKFKAELDAMGLNHLDVSLVDDGAAHGQSFMKLHLAQNCEVQQILSEGEQKGVALALFIAEQRMQQSANPIIMDDPVNSLDHQIISNFAERLALLDNQIIIFSHNVLLNSKLHDLNNVHACAENERGSCTKMTKHMYVYKIQSQGKSLKGIVVSYNQDNLQMTLLKAYNKLHIVPFTANVEVASLLRHAIELAVDEKVFCKLKPLQFAGKKNSIPWEQLKTLNANPEMIDTLKQCYSRLSGGDLHVGIESTENHIEYDELNTIYNALKAL